MEWLLDAVLVLPIALGGMVHWNARTWRGVLLSLGLLYLGVILINNFWVTF